MAQKARLRAVVRCVSALGALASIGDHFSGGSASRPLATFPKVAHAMKLAKLRAVDQDESTGTKPQWPGKQNKSNTIATPVLPDAPPLLRPSHYDEAGPPPQYRPPVDKESRMELAEDDKDGHSVVKMLAERLAVLKNSVVLKPVARHDAHAERRAKTPSAGRSSPSPSASGSSSSSSTSSSSRTASDSDEEDSDSTAMRTAAAIRAARGRGENKTKTRAGAGAGDAGGSQKPQMFSLKTRGKTTRAYVRRCEADVPGREDSTAEQITTEQPGPAKISGGTADAEGRLRRDEEKEKEKVDDGKLEDPEEVQEQKHQDDEFGDALLRESLQYWLGGSGSASDVAAVDAQGEGECEDDVVEGGRESKHDEVEDNLNPEDEEEVGAARDSDGDQRQPGRPRRWRLLPRSRSRTRVNAASRSRNAGRPCSTRAGSSRSGHRLSSGRDAAREDKNWLSSPSVSSSGGEGKDRVRLRPRSVVSSRGSRRSPAAESQRRRARSRSRLQRRRKDDRYVRVFPIRGLLHAPSGRSSSSTGTSHGDEELNDALKRNVKNFFRREVETVDKLAVVLGEYPKQGTGLTVRKFFHEHPLQVVKLDPKKFRAPCRVELWDTAGTRLQAEGKQALYVATNAQLFWALYRSVHRKDFFNENDPVELDGALTASFDTSQLALLQEEEDEQYGGSRSRRSASRATKIWSVLNTLPLPSTLTSCEDLSRFWLENHQRDLELEAGRRRAGTQRATGLVKTWGDEEKLEEKEQQREWRPWWWQQDDQEWQEQDAEEPGKEKDERGSARGYRDDRDPEQDGDRPAFRLLSKAEVEAAQEEEDELERNKMKSQTAAAGDEQDEDQERADEPEDGVNEQEDGVDEKEEDDRGEEQENGYEEGEEVVAHGAEEPEEEDGADRRTPTGAVDRRQQWADTRYIRAGGKEGVGVHQPPPALQPQETRFDGQIQELFTEIFPWGLPPAPPLQQEEKVQAEQYGPGSLSSDVPGEGDGVLAGQDYVYAGAFAFPPVPPAAFWIDQGESWAPDTDAA